MNIDLTLREAIQHQLQNLFGKQAEHLQIQPTNPEFEGSHTLVCFSLTKISGKNPEETAKRIGEALVQQNSIVAGFNVVKGFLNLIIKDNAWLQVLQQLAGKTQYGQLPKNGKEIMIEYSSPNTNKPLHLGHLRNNFLGWSVAEIYKANGYKVHKVQIINDRGIHICKSMAAWKLYGNGETPKTSGIKGDHLVGKYYVVFDKQHKIEMQALISKGLTEEEAQKQTPIMREAIDMLRKWEYRDPDTLQLWKTMNAWVYAGFDETYKKMGVDFDKLYYESNTFLLGKEQVITGLEKGVFFKKEDGSVWVDLTPDGLDQKVLLRSDGTSVYMTQDIGTAILRFHDFPNIEGQVYTVGNEQEYHFKVLFLILQKLGYDWAKQCYHLSYGMVDLPTGKMKSREGTVVDADDLIAEMVAEAKTQTLELGKTDELSQEEAEQLFQMIGLGALKFFLLKIDPKKRMLFDPNESIQLQGFTGPFIQYTHARIQAILRKANQLSIEINTNKIGEVTQLEPIEKTLIFVLSNFENKLAEAAKDYSPAIIANYVYEVAKTYNQFYQTISIFQEADQVKLQLRIVVSKLVAHVLKKSMHILGIQVPERM
ncbi:MAG: arginine--tRNA ligase [Cyclobacteriaceae bacterium]|jgi:arginyl-tRNA synthetase|nr:arginine--tRNA ligase [Cytophagales bacterium]MCZ8326687.1 arginine--tRNA ligase [Cyclobacteriaceae bacterium]